jgi:hypothetical protein
MRKLVAGLALLTVSTVLAPIPAYAGGSTDAALALGAFAVFNQIVRGETIFSPPRPVVVYAPPPVAYAPPPVVYAPPPAVYAPPAVLYTLPFVYAPAAPVVIYRTPVIVRPGHGRSFARGHWYHR